MKSHDHPQLDGSSSSRILVARVWMNMGVRRSEFRETPPSERWDEHRRLVLRQVANGKKAYQARVNRLVQAAVEAKADAILLPACTLVHGAGLALSNYLLPKSGLLISGALDVSHKPPIEYGIVAQDGVIVGTFRCNEIGRVSGRRFTAMVAISSTIKRLTLFPQEDPRNFGSPRRTFKPPFLLFDAGHHPYSDHYRRHTLRRAVDTIERRWRSPAATVLASWQYLSSKPSPSWCMPEECGTFCRLIDEVDILDMVAIKLAKQ